MARQYPTSASGRRALAAYIVNDLHTNPMHELIPTLVGTHKPQHQNGMITIGRIAFPASLVDADTPPELTETAFVFLVIHCLTLAVPIPVAASFARAEHIQHPTSLLRAEIWKNVAFLHIAPESVTTAMTCLRPDMIQITQTLYGQWLNQCRSPQHISAVLDQLVKSPWHTASDSKACRLLAKLIQQAQIAVKPVKHVAHADIVVDNKVGLIISRRDKCFLALILARGPLNDVIIKEIQAFASAKLDTPEAYSELPNGMHPLDELQPI